ncbi:hypothetical protein QTN47_02825 [Danxiaibacter flavus]|uniref:Uncharacterized protein n=1 Tax=Danxiaibacter flavus TaxID=3049108 RepID=A0ABV3Z987_9BACT|nr:hypothetical protein QNM32_02825 [Chitinophagaceae bacterium DXS]
MPVQEVPIEGLQVIRSIQSRIYEIRGFKVMLDRDWLHSTRFQRNP